jgi:leader peptidase (prepilin peptidase)/N-methyltransferase
VRVRPAQPATARFSAAGVTIGDDELDATWDDLLIHPRDTLRCQAIDVAAPGLDLPPSGTPVLVRVSRTTITIGETERPLGEIGTVTARLVSWEYPREVMGHGDLKLLAMVGGFLGPDATVFVLMGGALLGCVCGVVRAVAMPAQRHGPLPFGPFLAAGAVLWVLGGEAFVRWYGALLASLAT